MHQLVWVILKTTAYHNGTELIHSGPQRTSTDSLSIKIEFVEMPRLKILQKYQNIKKKIFGIEKCEKTFLPLYDK